MRMSTTLATLLDELDTCKSALPIETLCAQLSRADLRIDDLREWVHFGDECYRRNLVRLGPGYVALVLCWKSGQTSPIHDHRGSACALRVLAGQATERRYRKQDDGRLVHTATNHYVEGQVCGTWDADIHTMLNEQPQGVDLVTLHVYTPPMRSFRVYDAVSGEARVCADQEVLAEDRRRGLATAVET